MQAAKTISVTISKIAIMSLLRRDSEFTATLSSKTMSLKLMSVFSHLSRQRLTLGLLFPTYSKILYTKSPETATQVSICWNQARRLNSSAPSTNWTAFSRMWEVWLAQFWDLCSLLWNLVKCLLNWIFPKNCSHIKMVNLTIFKISICWLTFYSYCILFWASLDFAKNGKKWRNMINAENKCLNSLTSNWFSIASIFYKEQFKFFSKKTKFLDYICKNLILSKK